MAVGIVQFYHLIASEQETIDTKTSVNTYLKNLMHYIHQNFLVAAKFILSRIIKREENWKGASFTRLYDDNPWKLAKTKSNKAKTG